MRRVSMNARAALDSHASAAIEVALFQFEHPDHPDTIRLSTDPTERLSVEPLAYGTRSRWLGANPVTEPFLFVLASAQLPSDLEDAPATAKIVLENVDNDIAAILRSFTTPATVHMAVVLAESPDLVEIEYRNLRLVSAEGDAGEVRLSVSRKHIEEEAAPTDRFTKDRFPGLHR